MTNLRFFALLAAFLVGGVSAALGLLYWTTPYARVLGLGQVTYHEVGFRLFPLAVTPSSYLLLRTVLLACLLTAAAGLAALRTFRPAAWVEFRSLGRELRRASAALWQTWLELPRWQRRAAGLLLTALTSLRIALAFWLPVSTDEAASLDYFVRQGLVGITSFYPIPNNHIGANLLGWVAWEMTGHAGLTMRLPTLLVGLGGTTLLYALLLRYLRFYGATLALALFSLSPFTLYHSAVGRGYLLVSVCAGLAFFGLLAMLHSRQFSRTGAALFVCSSVAGFYTIPIFLYPFLSFLLYAGAYLLGVRRKSALMPLGAAGLLVLVVVALLYLPVVVVSGLPALTGNSYVVALTPAAFWQKAGFYLWALEGELLGQLRLGLGVFLLLGTATLVCLYTAPRGSAFRHLAGPALVATVLPYALLAAQRVMPPERVLFYKMLFLFILAGLLYGELVAGSRRFRRALTLLLPVLLLSYAAYQTYYLRQNYQPFRNSEAHIKRTYQWVAARQPALVFVEASYYQLFFYHYHLLAPGPTVLHSRWRRDQPYDLLVLDRREPEALKQVDTTRYAPAYQDSFVTIYERRSW
ncbi:hypothetical protein LJY25_00090 [Hymenobacter sp. BT175]|uniref:hypothetical protein n=1 Tax=Hymenobacter translucens TaxID=2886507 RepID=UPI001D0EE4C9|nr:hypothetical protein [Hymenobacter translucens]MCC2544828.1 hypothetical protein [Hymenobacter translucens]